jgi:hypothetical protein
VSRPPRTLGEEDVSVTSLRFSEPCLEYGAGDFGQRRTTLSSALADHAQVSTDAEHEVLASQAGHLGEAEARLGCCQNEGVISPPGPSTPIRSHEQSIYLRTREKLN